MNSNQNWPGSTRSGGSGQWTSMADYTSVQIRSFSLWPNGLSRCNLGAPPVYTSSESMRVHLAQIFFNNRTGCFARCLVTELLNVNTARMRLCHQDNQEPDVQNFLPLCCRRS